LSKTPNRIRVYVSDKLLEWLEYQATKQEKSLSGVARYYLEIQRSADLLGIICVPPIHVFRGDICTCGEKGVQRR